MRIVLIEPYYTGSHKYWADSLVKYSRHRIQLYSMPGRHWKWRMHGAAVYFARLLNDDCHFDPELILVSSMMDVALFKSLLNDSQIPVWTYFHENQLTYPKSQNDTDTQLQRDNHYGFINFSSALVSDKVIFNTAFNMSSFMDSAYELLSGMPDYKLSGQLAVIEQKSHIIPVGISTPTISPAKKKSIMPVLLWNHRWEYDKAPGDFYNLICSIRNRGIKFKLILLGEIKKTKNEVYDKISIEFETDIIHKGYVENKTEYFHWLDIATHLPITARHDFQGLSTLEVISRNVIPICPSDLVYREYIPEKYHRILLFDHFQDLVEKTVNQLENRDTSIACSQWAEPYKWENVMSCYDVIFESASGQNRFPS